jgi:hypothetical protein
MSPRAARPVSPTGQNSVSGLAHFCVRRPLAILGALCSLVLVSCSVDSDPAGPSADEPASSPIVDGQESPGFLTAPTHVMDPATFDLISRSDSADGTYRYRVRSPEAPTIVRDDFIVGRDGDLFLRRVLNAERSGEELVLRTAPAEWYEIVQGGTLEASVPLGSASGRDVQGPARHNPAGLGGATGLPRVFVPLDGIDVCALTDSLVALIPGNLPLSLCGQERNFSVGVAAVSVTVDGTLDELLIDEGFMEVTGTLAMSTTIDRGGVIGGRAPAFSPCNRAAYPGCLTTPTGAALFDWLRQYAPQIPGGSLRPVRVCIPLTPIRIRAGYWDFSGFLPKWVLPVYELCRVSDIGVLPTVELPSLEVLSFTPTPNLRGRLVMDVKGTGGLDLKITIPGVLGGTAGAKFGDVLSLKGTIGLFLRMDIKLYGGGARVYVDFDEGRAVTTTWTEAGGWTGDVQVTRTDVSGRMEPFGPDSVVARAGLQAEISAEACVAILGKCDLDEQPDSAGGSSLELKLGAEASAELFMFERFQWERTPNDNWTIDVDWLNEVKLGAGLNLPLEDYWVPPSVPIKWSPDPWEFGRVDMGNLYGTGRLQVGTSTTGQNLDLDGYQVRVERADTLPARIEAGATRLGPALDWGIPMTLAVDANGTRLLFPVKPPPCEILYTDAFLGPLQTFSPLALGAFLLARKVGLDPPNYALAYPCQLLVADHRVTLEGVAENCQVTGGASKVVALQQRNLILQRSDTAFVDFDVVCSASQTPLGSLDISTTYSGTDPDGNGYQISVDSAPWGSIGATDQRLLTGLTPNTRSVLLTDIAPNCSVVGSNPVDVVVPSGGAGTVTFEVACTVPETPAGAVRVSTTTAGATPDPDGYAFRLDGQLQARLNATGAINLPGVLAGDTAVLHISDVAENCRLNGLSPTTVTLDPVDQTGAALFDISCIDSPITEATGSIFVSSLPTPTAMLRRANGPALRLGGQLAAELLQMRGVDVAVHGVQTGGLMDLYGYEVVPPAEGDPRRVGIVVRRSGEYWLFGDDAVRLIDAPPRLLEQVGRLVWVIGDGTGGDVVPEAFGIIREGS